MKQYAFYDKDQNSIRFFTKDGVHLCVEFNTLTRQGYLMTTWTLDGTATAEVAELVESLKKEQQK